MCEDYAALGCAVCVLSVCFCLHRRCCCSSSGVAVCAFACTGVPSCRQRSMFKGLSWGRGWRCGSVFVRREWQRLHVCWGVLLHGCSNACAPVSQLRARVPCWRHSSSVRGVVPGDSLSADAVRHIAATSRRTLLLGHRHCCHASWVLLPHVHAPSSCCCHYLMHLP